MSGYYVLKGKTAKKAELMVWAKRYENADRHVAHEEIGDVCVSTVFLGLDHQYGDGPPMLFETMIFGGKHDEYQERCSTWEEAEKMHQIAVDLVRSDT